MNLLNKIIPSVTREEEFVLCHARTKMSGPARARIDRLLASPLDWNRVGEIAERHRLRALVHLHLKNDGRRFRVPEFVWKPLEGHTLWLSKNNLAQANELVRVVKFLRNEDIPVLPFKGPVLAAHIYGNLALREFSNLDLLIPAAELLRTKLLLVHQGFTSRAEPAKDQHLESQLGCDFTSVDAQTNLKLHSTLAEDSLGYRPDINAIWKRSVWVDLPKSPVRTIAREDLLPYLCVIGAKHHWSCISAIVDIAEFIHAEHNLEWQTLLNHAQTEDHWRVVALGLFLAYGLLDAPLPRDTVVAISTPEIKSLAESVGTWLFNDEKRPNPDGKESTNFYLKARQRKTTFGWLKAKSAG